VLKSRWCWECQITGVERSTCEKFLIWVRSRPQNTCGSPVACKRTQSLCTDFYCLIITTTTTIIMTYSRLVYLFNFVFNPWDLYPQGYKIIIITITILVIPGRCLWCYHESSPGSSDECRAAPSGRQPADQANSRYYYYLHSYKMYRRWHMYNGKNNNKTASWLCSCLLPVKSYNISKEIFLTILNFYNFLFLSQKTIY